MSKPVPPPIYRSLNRAIALRFAFGSLLEGPFFIVIHRLTLYSGNEKHFRGIAGLKFKTPRE